MTLPELKLCLNHLYHKVSPLQALHGLLLAVLPAAGEAAKVLVANPAPNAEQHLEGHLQVDGLELTSGQLRPRVATLSQDTTLNPSVHQVVLLEASQAFTLTLPVSAPVGTCFTLKDYLGTVATHAVTVEAGGAETIDGQASVVLDVAYERVQLMATGTGWVLL